MAEVAVMFLLDKLSKLTREESSSSSAVLGGIREDVEDIKNTFDGLTAALRAANEIEEIDPQVHTWVKLVRELAYGTEDVLDEFLFRFGGHRRSTIKNCRRKYALALQRIKAKLIHHSKYQPASLPTSSWHSSVSYSNKHLDHHAFSPLQESSDLVGIQNSKQSLVNKLLATDDDDDLKVHSVVGIGGLGKTALVKTVYNDGEVIKHFRYHVWVTVSKKFFKVKELLKDAIQQLIKQTNQQLLLPQAFVDMGTDHLKGFINNILSSQRYIIVLDDMWCVDAWMAIKSAFPRQSFGSRIIIIAPDSEIGAYVSGETHGFVYPLECLSPENSWTLFCKKAFMDGSCPQHLVNISKNILNTCDGLPLVIVVIAGMLATKSKDNIQEWERFHHYCLINIQSKSNDRIKNLLFLSYNDLPYYLKCCFLYLSVFPENVIIEKAKVIQLWIAEGFVCESSKQVKEEVAEGYLNELLHRNLIQIQQKTSVGRIKSIGVHNILRQLILSKSELEQNIAIIATRQDIEPSNMFRRLAIHKFYENILMRRSTSKMHLHSLLIFTHGVVSSSLSKLFTSDYSPLKVLDLEGVELKEIPMGVFNLFHLKYLSLRSTRLRNISKSVGSLQNLEILDLKYTNVMELPIEIIKLHKLSHLIVGYHWTGGFSAPFQIGELLSLQKLCYIRANETDGIKVVNEIGKLTQLRKLGVGKLRQEDGKELCSSLEKLTNLCSLSLTARINEILGIQHSLSTVPLCLRTLKLDGRLERVPQWLSSLVSLTKLYLCRSSLPEDPLGLLQDLPMLAHLDLYESYNGEELCFKAEKFPKLKFLRFCCFTALKRVMVEEAAMPLLEELHIADCILLEQVPLGIQHLSKLKSVVFIGLTDELMLSLDRNGRNYTKISHIPHKIIK